MNDNIQVSIKCKIGELLKPGFDGIKLGKYSLLPLPSESTDGFKTELLLNFKDEWEEGQQFSNPEQEGEIILSWLSMVLRQKLKLSSSRLNNVQTQSSNKEIISFDSPIDFPENILELYNKFKSLSQEHLRKFVRACECYQEALLVSTNNPTISFFLFVVCIECLSNRENDFYKYLIKEVSVKERVSKKEIESIHDKFNNEYGINKNFIQFILSNFDEWKIDFSEKEFKELLSSVYKIRSLFTHKGENLNKYIQLIDSRLKSKSIFTKIENKELEFPGLEYLSRVIRVVLINFLKQQEDLVADNIPKLASEDSKVNLVLTKSMQKEAISKGSPITKSQIKHRD